MDIQQGSLEISCLLTLVGDSKELKKIKKLNSAVPAAFTVVSEPLQETK